MECGAKLAPSFQHYRRPPSYDPLELRRFADTTIFILTVKSCQWEEIDVFFWIYVLKTVTNTFPKILQLADLWYLYRVNDFRCKINTLSNIISNKNHDIIDFASSTSVLNLILTDIRHTTISTYALLWAIFSVPNTVVSRGTPVFHYKDFFPILKMDSLENSLNTMYVS